MTFQPNQNLYGVAIGSTVGTGANYPHYDSRVPTTTDILFPIGQIWVFVGNSVWMLLSQTSGVSGTVSNWVEITSSSGSIVGVNGTTNQITSTTANDVATLSIPSTFIAPGSIASTTTLTGGTGITATAGNVTSSAGNLVATTGNLVLNGTGSGFVTTPTVVTAGASPQTANGRIVQVTFSGVSIAAGATQAFVINNTSVAAIGTVVDVSWFGATAGSALSIVSIVNVAGTSTTITMTNGTGATTSTDNITFVIEVLN